MRKPGPRPRSLSVALAGLLLLGACGGDDGSASPATTGSASAATAPPTTAAGDFPRTVQSALGEAIIPEAAERVVALGWTDMDVAVALGVTAIAVTEAPDIEGGMYPWLADALGAATPALVDIYTAGIPVERIAAVDPDLILAVNQYVVDDYAAERARPGRVLPGGPVG